jgi:hypothetical protein
METSIAELMSHIQVSRDQKLLFELMQKHEVLRVRLTARPARTQSDQYAIDKLIKRITDWELWHKRNREKFERVNERNTELLAQVSSLEEKMEKILRELVPPNARLFQGGIRKRGA